MLRDLIPGIESEAAKSAADHIDTLTFFRISSLEALSAFQQKIVLTVHERLTEFEEDYADLLSTPFSSYSINGVSIAFGSRVEQINGVVIPSELYALLRATGLCYPAI